MRETIETMENQKKRGYQNYPKTKEESSTGIYKSNERIANLQRLKDLSDKSPTWLSPKGKWCMITYSGLWRLDGGGSIPWGLVKNDDLSRILRDNESEIYLGFVYNQKNVAESINNCVNKISQNEDPPF